MDEIWYRNWQKFLWGTPEEDEVEETEYEVIEEDLE
jgi:hypothetical protein